MKYLKFLPIALVLFYTLLCVFRAPSIADAFILIAFSCLYGFYMFIEYKPHVIEPKPVQDPTLKNLEYRIAVSKLEKEIAALEVDRAKIVNQSAVRNERTPYQF